ncbi:protein mono-ADP-ribosyltransferase PARP12 isoform X2 [Onychostoma macrolepis]|uniref:protein mono-ADP-ribosyltransferase PARP12 isoform X2 n=1 Tax=Onychostoma macrolepis TaxID=369639 RepID=UPI002729DD66|nr:protein mono-ADP-ribosyltransferase PARP12 isoform X2 [Onychostoma macrolepis]
MNMASNYLDSDEGSYQQSSESPPEFSDSDTDSEAASDSGSGSGSGSDTEDDVQTSSKNVCMHYNRGHCRFGDKCRDEHVCKDFLKGSCKFGAGCRLNHNRQSLSSGQGRRRSRPSSEKLTAHESQKSRKDSEAASNSGSDTEDDVQTSSKQNVCMHYNRGHCQFGNKCRDEHVCKDFLKGSCKFGAGCRLNHNRQSLSSGQGRQRSRPSSEKTSEEFDGPYKWQLNFRSGWENISNDHILEAQFSLPSTKGIKIYNTQAGAISIDFTKMRVLQKTNIKVRRMSSKDTEWLWYYRADHSWCQYGDKGKASPIQSSDLETAYQNNRRGSVKFTIDSIQYEISFKEMCQKNLSTDRKRRIRRRPKYEPSQSGGFHGITSQLIKNFKNLSPSTNKTPEWQFKGRNQWHTFKNMGGCSVSSADIEKCYQQNQTSMNFTVNGDGYTLDFAKMSQVNQKTKAERKVRRV